MMTLGQWQLFQAAHPMVARGRHDALLGGWTDVVGHNESFAYDIGRLIAKDPPRIRAGFVNFEPYVDRAIRELRGG